MRLAGLVEQAQTSPSADETPDQKATKEMMVGRAYSARHNETGAINRFKIVITGYRTSQYVEEALARLAQSYETLGINQEAQTAVAVLERQFPNGQWTRDARDALKALGLTPAEDERSWISKAFK